MPGTVCPTEARGFLSFFFVLLDMFFRDEKYCIHEKSLLFLCICLYLSNVYCIYLESMLLRTYSFSRLIELTLYRSMGRSQSNRVPIGKEPFPCSDVLGMLETPEMIGVLEVLEMSERLNIINTI